MFETNPLLHHAEELLRRVSPEGRARARRLRERRKRAFNRLMIRIAAAAIAVAGALAAPRPPTGRRGRVPPTPLLRCVRFGLPPGPGRAPAAARGDRDGRAPLAP